MCCLPSAECKYGANGRFFNLASTTHGDGISLFVLDCWWQFLKTTAEDFSTILLQRLVPANMNDIDMQGDPLRALKDARLLQRIADNTFSLAIVLADKTKPSLEEFADEEQWTALEDRMKQREAACSQFFAAELKEHNPQLAEAGQHQFPVIHYFTRESLGLLAALQQDELPPDHELFHGKNREDVITKLLTRTRAPALYKALLAVCQ